MSPHRYALYGLTLESSRELPGLFPSSGPGDVVHIDFAGPAEHEPGQAPFFTNGFETLWHLGPETWLLQYHDTRFAGYRWTLRYDGGERVTVGWDSEELLADIPPVLQGPGIAASLHLRGVPLLHACAIDVDGGAILLMGTPGAGKSTTAAALLRAGCSLLSDDVAALSLSEERVIVQPGYPRLRLFGDSASAAGWDAGELHRAFVSPLLGDKRFVDLAGGRFTPHALPVRAIYVLQQRRPGGGDPSFGAVERNAAWSLLAQNVYSLRFLDPMRRLHIVRDCAVVAARVPVRTVQASDDLSALPRLVDLLTRDALGVSW